MAGRGEAGGTAETRTGFGSDRHPFGPGDGLWLAGVEIQGAPRLHGHSDGDAALHAVTLALLGAAALGDLGDLYPADERTPRGEASSSFVRDVVARLAVAGWRPASVDLTIRAGRPRLAGSVSEMRATIAALLGTEEANVSLKLSTGNLSGDAGAGRVIEADAVATVTSIGDGS